MLLVLLVVILLLLVVILLLLLLRVGLIHSTGQDCTPAGDL